MLGDDNQRETASPSYQRGHRLPAESLQQNGTEGEYAADRGHAIAATCEATAQRLRLQTEQLKRFHQQICLRVNERVLQQREQQQSRDKQIDAKLARLLQLPPTTDGDGDPLRAAITMVTAPPALQLSRGPHLEALLNAKRGQLRGYDKALSVVEKVLRSDAQAREMLLASTQVPRVRACRSCEDVALEKIYEDEGNQAGDGNGEHLARDGDVALPAKQRVELYAAVRRRYMAIERERVHQRRKGAGELPSERNLVTKLPPKGKKPVSTNRRTESERRSGGHVTIVDASTGCETKVQRQVARTSSTPWRNSPSQQPPPSSTKSQAQATTQERFLTALQAELGTPALCSCGGRKGNVECANNCEFYRQPKRKERAAASVCKQHET